MTYTLVANDIWRGPEPQTPADIAQLRSIGIVTDIHLEEHSNEALELPFAGVVAKLISPWQIYVTGISQEYLAEIQTAIRDYPKPMLVHCKAGKDRAGLIIATYRVEQMGWTKDNAMQEAISFGYRNRLNFGLNRTWRELVVS